AVDAHVDQHLWQHLIGPNGLLKDKTRLLVTHGIHHLEYVDQIIVLNDGRVTETGEYQELMRAKEAFYQLITDYSVQEKKKQQAQLLALEHEQQQRMVSKSNIDIDDTTSAKVGEVFTKQPDDAMEARSENGKAKRDTDIAVADPGSNSTAKPKGDLIGMENLEVGNVGWGAYWEYAKAISLRQACICLLLYTLAQGCQISTSFWLRYWVTQEEKQSSDRHSTAFYLSGYALLVAVYIAMDVTVSYMTNVTCGIQGAKALHDGLLVRVLRMPMSFFDTTPMGRIVNRFSSDVTTVDSELPAQLPALLGWIFTSLGIIVVIAFSTPQFLIAVTPLAIIFFTIQSYYIRT
ncbi:Canalicular multispecific organic anion transporter 2, partial [Lobosporangium transversale]